MKITAPTIGLLSASFRTQPYTPFPAEDGWRDAQIRPVVGCTAAGSIATANDTLVVLAVRLTGTRLRVACDRSPNAIVSVLHQRPGTIRFTAVMQETLVLKGFDGAFPPLNFNEDIVWDPPIDKSRMVPPAFSEDVYTFGEGVAAVGGQAVLGVATFSDLAPMVAHTVTTSESILTRNAWARGAIAGPPNYEKTGKPWEYGVTVGPYSSGFDITGAPVDTFNKPPEFAAGVSFRLDYGYVERLTKLRSTRVDLGALLGALDARTARFGLPIAQSSVDAAMLDACQAYPATAKIDIKLWTAPFLSESWWVPDADKTHSYRPVGDSVQRYSLLPGKSDGRRYLGAHPKHTTIDWFPSDLFSRFHYIRVMTATWNLPAHTYLDIVDGYAAANSVDGEVLVVIRCAGNDLIQIQEGD